jgi:hypothetical protein
MKDAIPPTPLKATIACTCSVPKTQRIHNVCMFCLFDHVLERDRENEQLRAHGSRFATLCFNLSQDTKIEERHRKVMRESYEAWDRLVRKPATTIVVNKKDL